MINSLRHIYALLLRQVYLIKRSPPRWISYVFWPTLQMIIWGYLNKFLYLQSGLAAFALTSLLGANLLVSFFERSNVQIMWGFLEDVWARNIGNVLISPIRPLEMLAGYILNGLIAVLIGMATAILVAYLLFDYSLFQTGIYLIPFISNLIMSGWCIGLLLISLLFRYGASGEHFGWMAAFIITPFIAVYYPVDILPLWAQKISWALPPTYVFEGLRQFIKTGTFNWALFRMSLLLNLGYFVLSIFVFMNQLNAARRRGGLFSMSE
ncbi:MAG: type transporter [Alphaproteobacteria bacterium]|nr:type transporter [Alphaproteobacteria bacterium]